MMSSDALISLCWITLGVSALGMVGGAAIGAAYNPGGGIRYLTVALLPVIGIGCVLFLLPRARGAVRVLTLIVACVSGVALVGVFGYRLVVDIGDALFWAPPLLLGVGLVALAVALVREAGT